MPHQYSLAIFLNRLFNQEIFVAPMQTVLAIKRFLETIEQECPTGKSYCDLAVWALWLAMEGSPKMQRNMRHYREAVDIVLVADPTWKQGWLKHDRHMLLEFNFDSDTTFAMFASPSITLWSYESELPDMVFYEAIATCKQQLGISTPGSNQYDLGMAAIRTSGAVFELVSMGEGLDGTDEDGNTAIHYMVGRIGFWGLWQGGAQRGSQELAWRLRRILSAGADIDHKNNEGNTVLHTSARISCRLQSVVLNILISKGGVDPTVSDRCGRLSIYYLVF